MNEKILNMIRACFAEDPDGKVHLRIVESKADPKDLKNAIRPGSNPSVETLLKRCIVLDESGNPALSLVHVPFGKTKEDEGKKKRQAFLSRKEEEAKAAAKVAKEKADELEKAAAAKTKEAKEAAAAKDADESAAKAKAEKEAADKAKAFTKGKPNEKS